MYIIRRSHIINTLPSRDFYPAAVQCPSTHCDARPKPDDVSLLVIHNISLPPEQFGGHYIEAFFCGLLDKSLHPYFAQISEMRVSAHCLIKRDGEIIQFVPFTHRAWHAGKSSFQGRGICNDYSIGIELEGTDHIAYTSDQYASLVKLSQYLMTAFPHIKLSRIVGHCDISPARKTDPGQVFDWPFYRQCLIVL